MPEIEINRVKLDLDDVWDAISDAEFVEELNDRAGNGAVCDWLAVAIENGCECDEPVVDEIDEAFAKLSDWDLDALKAAIAADDGRRVIDLLKRAMQ